MKLNKILFNISIIFISLNGFAQFPSGGGKGMDFNMGKLYGKIQDSITGKPIPFATLFVYGNKFDTMGKMQYGVLLTGGIARENGEFNLDGLPIMGKLKLKIKAIGYDEYETDVSFNVNMKEMMKQGGGSDNPNRIATAFGAMDKDIGNIKMSQGVNQLKEVEVVSEVPDVEFKLDKKIYNVGKDITVSGGTGEDVLKNVPTVTVDMDGKVSMRNASPQIFVDGRPSTLTVDQIPADAIETIEVISNPSAKYDASGGMAGIINIVLKKNRRMGYNGNIRAGVDQRGKVNFGADLNVREGKFNFFVSAFGNQRKSIGTSETIRKNLTGYPLTDYTQINPTVSNRFFGFGRGGIDYFINNRNTITLSGNYVQGVFDNSDQLKSTVNNVYDSTTAQSQSMRYSDAGRSFRNLGGSLLYKHLFPAEGKELTADLNFNTSTFANEGLFETKYFDNVGSEIGTPVKQKQNGSGDNTFFTFQTDYTHPIKKTMKIEAGVRAAVKNSLVNNQSYFFNPLVNDYELLQAFGSHYQFNDQIYAAYLMYSHEIGKLTYQIGLRLESSFYSGKFVDSTQKYYYQYPVAPFPSFSGTYKINDQNNIQLGISRRVNRPGIFQLIPVTDYSDSLNITKGNPALRPEFTNTIELSYMHYFSKKNYATITAYYKYTTDLISAYQYVDYNTTLQKNILINSYENSNFSNAYGVELSSKFYFGKKVDITPSANLYYAVINSSNIDSALINERLNWFARLRLNIEIIKNLSLQLNANYTGKSNQPANERGDGGHRASFHGVTPATAQGYTLPVYFFDAGLKYDFLKDKKASLTLNVSDFLKTRVNQTHTESNYFVQDVNRQRDQLFFRLSFNYRFGKFDMSLFKKKNMNMNSDGMEMGM